MSGIEIFLLAFVFLVGCDYLKIRFQMDQSQTLYIGAGQSNMARQDLSKSFANSVNVAVGSTYLSNWQKGAPRTTESWESAGPLYERIIKAVKDNPSLRPMLLFWQGESEGLTGIGATTWGQDFLTFVRTLRKDIGPIPVIYVQIGKVPTLRPSIGWNEVKRQQAMVNGTLENLTMIKSDDLDFGPDGLHYTDASYAIIQRRLQQATTGFYER